MNKSIKKEKRKIGGIDISGLKKNERKSDFINLSRKKQLMNKSKKKDKWMNEQMNPWKGDEREWRKMLWNVMTE